MIVSKESAKLNAQTLISEKRKSKRIVSLNPTVTWDNGTISKVKQLSNHNVMRSVRRNKIEDTIAPLNDMIVRSEDEVIDVESTRLKGASITE